MTTIQHDHDTRSFEAMVDALVTAQVRYYRVMLMGSSASAVLFGSTLLALVLKGGN